MSAAAGEFAALDLLPEAVVIVDATGRVAHVNERARGLLALSPAARGRALGEVIDLRDESGTPCIECLTPAGDVADRLAERLFQVELPDGRQRPVAVAGRLLDDGRRVLTFRHAGRRVRVDAQRSDLVATVSHEIRSPLTSVKGFTRTLLARWDRFSDEQKRQMLMTINEDADRVTRLLTELLDVSRIDAGRVQLQRVVLDVRRVVQRVVDKAQHVQDEDPLVLVELPDEVGSVYADADKLEQVLTNLVENALHYAPGAPIRVAVRDGDEGIEISVADGGAGIPADQLRSIFGKFSRGRGTKRAGTGLGLYITKGLVEAHGGRVWAESTPGEGATFHVVLPKGGIELGLVGDIGLAVARENA